MSIPQPAPIYRVSIDWKNRVYELFDDFDDAVYFARGFMEADGTLRFLGEKTPGSGILKWEDTITGKKIFKTVGTANNRELFEYEMAKRREAKEKHYKELGNKFRENHKKMLDK